MRKDKRKEIKRKLRDDKNFLYKKQRLIDSDDEDIQVYQPYLANTVKLTHGQGGSGSLRKCSPPMELKPFMLE